MNVFRHGTFELILEAATILLSMSSSPSSSGGMDSGSGTDSKLFISTSSEKQLMQSSVFKSLTNSSNDSLCIKVSGLAPIVSPGLGIDRDPPADDIGDADEESELLCGDEVDDMADDDDAD